MLDDHFPEVDEPSQGPRYNVKLTVNTSNEDYVTTRATGTQAGKGAENIVKPELVAVMFYMGTGEARNSGKAVSAFRPNFVEVASDDGTTYVLSGDVDTVPSESVWRIEVVANAPNFSYSKLPFGTTSDFLSDTTLVQHSTFQWPAGTVPSSSNPIPMYGHYGKKSYTLPLNQPYGYEYDLTGYVPYLIRAVAKIVVRSNEDLGIPTISRCYTVGMVFPQNARNSDGAFSSISDANLNIPSATTGQYDNGVETNVAFSVLDDGTTTTKKYKHNYVLYVPEYCTVATQVIAGFVGSNITMDIPADEEPVISFKFNGQDKSFKFGTYVDGKYSAASNILRNHIYEYIVNTTPLSIQYSVRPWDEQKAGDITFN
jgi:hypothetical protein